MLGKKDLGPSGKEILLQLPIVCLTLLSAFMHLNATRMLVHTFYDDFLCSSKCVGRIFSYLVRCLIFCIFSSYILQLLQNVLVIENQRENVGVDVFIRLVGGGLAGITAASVTYPLDLVRTRLAAQVRIDRRFASLVHLSFSSL